jgi:SNF2 family DNA or RNA helicase
MHNIPEQKPNIVAYKAYFKTTPYNHQFYAFKENLERLTYAYFMEMGTGKTKVMIDTITYLYTQGRIKGALIVAPKSVYRNWIGEFEKHCAIPYTVTYYSSYQTKKYLLNEKRFMDEKNILKIYLMNVEALSHPSGLKAAHNFQKNINGQGVMAIDESTTIKSPAATRTKNCIAIGALFKYKRILTGQPVANSPLDLYSQCLFLDWRWLGARNFTAFKARYAIMQQMVMGTRRFLQVVGFQRIEELQEKLGKFSFRVTKAECLDLPPKVYVTRNIEMPEAQAKIYAQMKVIAVLELEQAGLVTASMVMTKLEKLHQIVCGHVKSDKGIIERLPNNRISSLLELLDEVSGKALIWCAYQEDVRMVTEAIKKEYGNEVAESYYGNTSADNREEIRINFQKPEHPLRFFVGTPATGRFGATLTQANVVIYYSNSYNLEHRNQSEDRTHRIGSEIHDKITYIDLVTPETVDEKIIDNLSKKNNIANLVTRDISDDNWKTWFN